MKLTVGCLIGLVLVLVAIALHVHRKRTSSQGEASAQALSTTDGGARAETAEIHLNTMLIGGTCAGRDALTQALLRQTRTQPLLANEKPDSEPGTSARYVELVVDHRHVSQIAPAENQHPHSLLLQAGPVDGVVLMTSPSFDLSPSAREQAILLAAAGVHQFLVLVEGTSLESSAILEARMHGAALSLLAQSGRVGQDVAVVVGGATDDIPLTARCLLRALTTKLTGRHRDSHAPFRLMVDDVFRIKGRGVIATGMVERGTLHVGDRVAILFRGLRRVVDCQGIETYRGELRQARAGSNVGVLLGSLEPDAVARGAVLAAPEGTTVDRECRGNIHLLRLQDHDEMPRLDPSWKGRIVIGTQEVEATVRLSAERADGAASNGGTNVVVTTAEPVVMEPGGPLVLLHDGRSIGVGLVTQ
jgi:elongation factor Tu